MDLTFDRCQTPAEWQAAVDTSRALLVLASGRDYGVMTGGRKLDAERCIQMLELGRARGFEPAEDAAERLLGELVPMRRWE
jgi:hypothetical protein